MRAGERSCAESKSNSRLEFYGNAFADTVHFGAIEILLEVFSLFVHLVSYDGSGRSTDCGTDDGALYRAAVLTADGSADNRAGAGADSRTLFRLAKARTAGDAHRKEHYNGQHKRHPTV